jgi:hypothetical protein
MKSRTFISILILVFVVMIIAGSCATGKKASVTKEDEVLFGTWINPDYDTTWGYGKIIIKPDGAYDEYKRSSSDSPTTK